MNAPDNDTIEPIQYNTIQYNTEQSAEAIDQVVKGEEEDCWFRVSKL